MEIENVSNQIELVGRRLPNRPALVRAGESLTFKSLNERADQFADFLRKCGHGKGAAVALCLDRSFEWIVSALGAMRAGCAYVPLDPAWPESRLRFAVEDSGAMSCVSRTAILDRLRVAARGIDPALDAAAISGTVQYPANTVALEDVAYVIYTSGSSGRPKGVEITHGNLANLSRWHRRTFCVTESDRASHLAGQGFDAAAWEVWPNLCAGATLVLIDDAGRSSADSMQDWMIRERITIGFAPTILAQQMMAMRWPSDTTLRYLLTGGDALQNAPPAGLPFKVVNNYGPTECCVVSTSGRVIPESDTVPSIGKEIIGAKIYLLNEMGETVKDGCPGEIYIAGHGVGRGYRNLTEETAGSFLRDPFSTDPRSRMFRTGDRACRLENGDLQFLGRLDRQVKIRGNRVELDEIGAALKRHPAIECAIATCSSETSISKSIVAHILFKKDVKHPPARDLQDFLRAILPNYMIPAKVIELGAVPLSANGKIDFAALGLSGTMMVTEVAPSGVIKSPIELKVLSLVRSLLDDNSVTTDDNFFLAGGHSLLGMQLILHVQKELGVDLNLQELFEAPSVTGIAVLIEGALNQRKLSIIWQEVLGCEGVGSDDDFVLWGGNSTAASLLSRSISREFHVSMSAGEVLANPTIRQQEEFLAGKKSRALLPSGVLALRPYGARTRIFWIHYVSANLARVIGDDQPFYSVSLTASDVEMLGSSPNISEIAKCIVRKIIAVQPSGPYIIGGLCLGGVLAYEIALQLRAAGQKTSIVVLIDPPILSHSVIQDSLAKRWEYFRYVVKRAEWLGPKKTCLYIGERLIKRLPHRMKTRLGVGVTHIAQDMIEDSIFRYDPPSYDGKVLLVMASRRPDAKSNPVWPGLRGSDLRREYIDTYHRELMSSSNARRIAVIIRDHMFCGRQE